MPRPPAKKDQTTKAVRKAKGITPEDTLAYASTATRLSKILSPATEGHHAQEIKFLEEYFDEMEAAAQEKGESYYATLPKGITSFANVIKHGRLACLLPCALLIFEAGAPALDYQPWQGFMKQRVEGMVGRSGADGDQVAMTTAQHIFLSAV